MIRTTADPRELVPWHHLSSKREFLGYVTDRKWFNNHPIPVFLIPSWSPLKKLGKYLINDGTNRTIASLKLGIIKVPILILESTSDINRTMNTEYHFLECGGAFESRPYEKVLQNALEFAINYHHPHRGLSFGRLQGLRTRAYQTEILEEELAKLSL